MHKRYWLLVSFFSLLLTASTFSNKCLAGGSGYYEVPDSGRPISAFSLCCCKKEDENEQQTFYNCKHVDERECPEGTKQYNASLSQCPSSLMFTKYENKNK